VLSSDIVRWATTLRRNSMEQVGPAGGATGGTGSGRSPRLCGPCPQRRQGPPQRQPRWRRRSSDLPRERAGCRGSGDVNQSLSVSNRGDNSTQCVGIQRAANTGNAQNLIDVIQHFSEMDDFEFVEVGSTIEVNLTSETRCDRQITTRPHQLAARGVQ
jgi:hypothetical protein